MSGKASSSKKVSIACNTCRVKRKKCDGLDPCSFCITSGSEPCSYSREPKRRGPPSGYLRHVEAKSSLLEILLGLVISRSPTSTLNTILLDCVQALLSESTTATQDVWDAYKVHWSNSPASAILDQITAKFAPYTPRTEDAVARALLPLSNTDKGTMLSSISTPLSSQTPLPPPSTSSTIPLAPVLRPQHKPASPLRRQMQQSEPSQASYLLGRESFERTQTAFKPVSPPYWNQLNSSAQDFNFPDQDVADISCSLPSPATSSNKTHTELEALDEDISMMDATLLHDGYTGSYWRSADLSFPSPSYSPEMMSVKPLPQPETELPPLHIISHLLDVYFSHIHTSLPILSSRASLEKMLSSSAESSTALFLSLCAYMGRLSPSLGSTSIEGSGEAGKIASDLWYEQARNILATSLLRKPSQIETVQSLLLLGLRDHGKGHESQAWLLIGVAIRMGQDISLHRDDEDSPARGILYPEEENLLRKNVWRITTSLDLFLALQLGRPPGISDALKPSAKKMERLADPSSPEQSQLLSHAADLCRIIARINFQLHLGHSCDISSPSLDHTLLDGFISSSDPGVIARTKLNVLKTELSIWHDNFPQAFRISIGHHPPERDILEINMLYQVAIILLYRPFSKDPIVNASEVYLDAASTFNILMDKFRTAPPLSASGHTLPSKSLPSLTLANPRLIYLIFTVAIAHLSGFKLFQQRENSSSVGHYSGSRMALQTQLHLMNCLDALNIIGGTWELANRCCKTLDRFMELEGMKPDSIGSADNGKGNLKRKRSLTEDMNPRRGSAVSPAQILQTSSTSQILDIQPQASGSGLPPSQWTSPFAMVDQPNETLSPYFYNADPSGWMAEILQSVEASEEVQGLWNGGEWNEALWGLSSSVAPS